MATRLPLIFGVFLVAAIIISAEAGSHKKIVIHVPYEIKIKHHTHTIHKIVKEEPKKKHKEWHHKYFNDKKDVEEPKKKEWTESEIVPKITPKLHSRISGDVEHTITSYGNSGFTGHGGKLLSL